MGNFFSDLFGGKEEVKYYKPKVLKETAANAARQAMANLSSQTVEYPTRPIVGMAPAELTGQNILADILAGKAYQDPMESPLYLGMRQQIGFENQEGLDTLRRTANKQGMYNSIPGGRAEADYLAKAGARNLTLLGGMIESERNRDNPYTRLAAASTYGALPRMLAQQQADAEYNKTIQDLLAPYQLQFPLWQQLIGNEVWTQPSVTSQPSLFSQIATMAPMVSQLISGLPMGGSGGINFMGMGVNGTAGNAMSNYGTANSGGMNAFDRYGFSGGYGLDY